MSSAPALALAAAAALLLLAEAPGGHGAPVAAGPYGAAVAAAARASLGVKETAPNNGPEIAAWAAELGLSPPLQWCGVAVSHWLREASKTTGLPLVVPGSGRAKGLLAQFQAAGRALTAEQARRRVLPAGTVLVWDRAKAPGGPEGHTGVVESDDGDAWTTIEGNTEHNDVRRVRRQKSDPRLLGAGLVDGAAGASGVPPRLPAGPAPAPAPAPGKSPPPPPPPPPPPAGAGRLWMAGDSHANGLAGPLGKLLAPRKVIDAGKAGTTIRQWTNPAGPGAAVFAGATPADLVLLSLGTNDLAAGVTGSEAAEDVRLLLGVLRMRTPRIGWVGPPEMAQWPGHGVRARLAQVLSEEGVPYFPSDFESIPRGADGVHATPAGYQSWAAAIVQWAITNGLV